jgi:hypothetical protein
MKRIVLLQTPAHAAGEVRRIMKAVREDRMPRDQTGIEDPLDKKLKAALLESRRTGEPMVGRDDVRLPVDVALRDRLANGDAGDQYIGLDRFGRVATDLRAAGISARHSRMSTTILPAASLLSSARYASPNVDIVKCPGSTRGATLPASISRVASRMIAP